MKLLTKNTIVLLIVTLFVFIIGGFVFYYQLQNIMNEEAIEALYAKKEKVENVCPKCKTGNILKGNTAYGCSGWKNGCNFRLPFEFFGKLLSEKDVQSLIKKGETSIVKGMVKDGAKINGKLKLDADFVLTLDS